MKRLAIVLIVTGLSGCGSGDMDDLHRFVAETGKDMQGKIDPLPEVKAYEPFSYSAFDLPDPFKPRKLTTGGGGGACSPISPARRSPWKRSRWKR